MVYTFISDVRNDENIIVVIAFYKIIITSRRYLERSFVKNFSLKLRSAILIELNIFAFVFLLFSKIYLLLFFRK